MLLSKEITFDYAHRLAHHGGACSNLHGHTGRLVVEIEGTPDPTTGMVMDFSDLKAVLQPVRQRLDHVLILNVEFDSFLIEALRPFGFHITAFPFEPTAENLAKWAYNELRTSLPVSRVIFYETLNNWATYEGGEA